MTASTPKERLNHNEAKALVSRIYSSQEAAQGNMTKSQEQYTRQANKHRREVDFVVGDKVQVTTKYQKTDQPSRKLANQIKGLFEILEQIGYSFKLKLPKTCKVYPVFYAKKLYKDPINPLPGQANTEPPLIAL